MDSFTVRATQRFGEDIEALVKSKTNMVVESMAGEYPSYTRRVGFIEGLKHAFKIMKDVEQELSRSEEHDDRAPMHSRRYEE